jgi:hypothetical protein
LEAENTPSYQKTLQTNILLKFKKKIDEFICRDTISYLKNPNLLYTKVIDGIIEKNKLGIVPDQYVEDLKSYFSDLVQPNQPSIANVSISCLVKFSQPF